MATVVVALSGSRSSTRGFTLLELLVVIVLIGILLSVVTITVTPDDRQLLARDAERVGQLFAVAADESRIRQQPMFWEADLNGYRFVTLKGGERQLIRDDDLLRERAWREPLQALALIQGRDNDDPRQVVLGPGAPPVRLAIGREWIQPPMRLELSTRSAQVAIDFDERGRGTVQSR